MRAEPISVAAMYINQYYPHCQGAILAGSALRGEATVTSDLDIVIFDSKVPSPYRHSLIFNEWPVEVFVHNLSSYQVFFENDCARARPSLPNMVSEGMVIKDLGVIASIKAEADLLLAAGPKKWSEEDLSAKRYFLTDTLDDFIGSESRPELLFIAAALAQKIAEFVLRTNRQWIGDSKWIYRSLRNFDGEFAEELTETFDRFYKTGEKDPVIRLTERILEPFGGRLFDGYSAGKKKRYL